MDDAINSPDIVENPAAKLDDASKNNANTEAQDLLKNFANIAQLQGKVEFNEDPAGHHLVASNDIYGAGKGAADNGVQVVAEAIKEKAASHPQEAAKQAEAASAHPQEAGETKKSTTDVSVTGEHDVKVKPGDSLWKIAGQELGPGKHSAQEVLAMVNKIAEANHLKNPNMIHPGEKLTIPGHAKVEETSKGGQHEKAADAKGETKKSTTDVSVTDKHDVTVKSGDSLWKIASKELGPGKHSAQEIADMAKQIAEANHLKNPNMIHPGDKLTIPAHAKVEDGGKHDPGKVEQLNEVKVQQGDTLWKIASHELGPGKHSAQEILEEVKKIAELNHIKNPNMIHPGEKLKMPPKHHVEPREAAKSGATKVAIADWDGDDDKA